MKLTFKVRPWTHQYNAIKRSINKDHFALFFEQGTGKTLTLVNMLRTKCAKEKRLLRTLVLTPRIVIPNWVKEIKMHSHIRPSDIIPLSGSVKKRAATVKQFGWRANSGSGKIFITNYDVISKPELLDTFWEWGVECLILDESHKCKSRQSKRTKAVIKLADVAKYCFLASGTPTPNGIEDIWAQFRIMDKGKTFGRNFFIWRAQYFYDKNAGMPKHMHFPEYVPRPDKIESLNNTIARHSMRVKKEECLDLPPLVKVPIEVGLSKEQAKAYKEMKKAFITFVEDKACVAEMALTKGLRLQQILSGFIPLETQSGEKSIKRFSKVPRLEALKELLEEYAHGSKIIVWAVFKENYSMIREVCEALSLQYVEVHGGISDKEKDENVRAFNEDEKVRVFIGNPSSGGIGINLVSSNISIFYSRGFSLEADLQAEARNHRGGSEVHNKVTRYDLFVKDTIDEKIMQSLSKKEKITEAILTQMAKDMRRETLW